MKKSVRITVALIMALALVLLSGCSGGGDYSEEGGMPYRYAEDGEQLQPEITATALEGSAGVNVEEYCPKLFDFDLSTKWCMSFAGNAYVVWELSEAVVPTGYTIVTGGDSGRFKGRNPKSWTLYASDSATAPKRNDSSWEAISVVENDVMLDDRNTERYYYQIEECDGEYKYYKLEVSATSGSEGCLQLSEFSIDYDGAEYVYDNGIFYSDQLFIGTTFISDGFSYDVRVGDNVTFYHPRTATSSYYAYSWVIRDGDGMIALDHTGDATCGVTGVKEGTVNLEATLYYHTGIYQGATMETVTYNVTVNVLPADAERPSYGNSPTSSCFRCNGTGQTDCPGCYGDGMLSGGARCSCGTGKITCYLCNGSGSRE